MLIENVAAPKAICDAFGSRDVPAHRPGTCKANR